MSLGERPDHLPGIVGTPMLLVDADIWQKLNAYVQACPIEVSGFGYITQIGPTVFRLDDVFILPQRATAASVTVEAREVHSHMYRMVQHGVPTGALRFQWHSHVNFAAYFSSVDTNNIEQYANGWMLSLVINKFGEFEARLDVFEPFRVYAPLKVSVVLPENAELIAAAQAEVQRFVTNDDAVFRRRVRADSTASVEVELDAEEVSIR